MNIHLFFALMLIAVGVLMVGVVFSDGRAHSSEVAPMVIAMATRG